MMPNHFPASLTHHNSHHDEGYAPCRTLSDKQITQAGPSPGPLLVDQSSHSSMFRVPVPNCHPLTSNSSSSASAAAKALEKAKKEQERERRRAEKECSNVDQDSDKSRTNSTPQTHLREQERALSIANAPWGSFQPPPSVLSISPICCPMKPSPQRISREHLLLRYYLSRKAKKT